MSGFPVHGAQGLPLGFRGNQQYLHARVDLFPETYCIFMIRICTHTYIQDAIDLNNCVSTPAPSNIFKQQS